VDDLTAWARSVEKDDDPLFFSIIDLATSRSVGWASYLRIDPEMGSIEVGHIAYSPTLQRTAAATEAMYLMMRRVFDELAYRRYEWKCDSLNAPSWNAAERLGFRHEGIHRQALVRYGRNRDNAWFSILDSEWPGIREALEHWLDPVNFDNDGRQRRRLTDFMAETRR
jgi:RimJ/RimL family protein N-acetyltransferase